MVAGAVCFGHLLKFFLIISSFQLWWRPRRNFATLIYLNVSSTYSLYMDCSTPGIVPLQRVGIGVIAIPRVYLATCI